MMQLKRVGEPIVSPDSKWVAFTRGRRQPRRQYPQAASVDRAGCRWRGPASDSRDAGRAKIASASRPTAKAFSSSRRKDGGSQIWVQDFDTASGTLTGEARKVTTISTEASGALWSPDGKSILFVSAVYPDCKDDACNKQRDESAPSRR